MRVEPVRIRARGKVNLVLDVIEEKNGMHLLDMVMAPISLADTLVITPSREDEIISSIPLPEKNTLTRTLEALRKKGLKGHYRIEIDKKIPSEAGLGGGSSDAAALIRALVSMENLAMEREEMEKLAFSIGADTVFFLQDRAARVRGYGEIITPFELKEMPAVLVRPEFGISTPACFRRWDEMEALHVDTEAFLESCRNGMPKLETMRNSLEKPAFSLEPSLEEIRQRLLEQGADHVVMSGSGSTLVCLSEREEDLDAFLERIRGDYPFVEKVWIGDISDREDL